MNATRRIALGCAVALALLLAVTAVAPLAHSFGRTGHRAAGGIADLLLAAKSRTEVAKLLAKDPDLFGSPSGRTTLLQVANWADEICKTEAHEPYWHNDKLQLCNAPPRPIDGLKFCTETSPASSLCHTGVSTVGA